MRLRDYTIYLSKSTMHTYHGMRCVFMILIEKNAGIEMIFY